MPSDNDNKSFSRTSFKTLKASSNKTLEVKGREVSGNNHSGGAIEKTCNRKATSWKILIQPDCNTGPPDNLNKIFNRDSYHDSEILATENKICDLTDDENQCTANTDASELDTESSSSVSCDQDKYYENCGKGNGSTYQRKGKTGTRVAEEKNKGVILSGNQIGQVNEKPVSFRESWGEPAGSTTKGMQNSTFYIDLEQPEITEVKEISGREVLAEIDVSDIVLADPEEESESLLSSPGKQMEIAGQEPPTKSKECVDGSGSIHTPLELPKEHPNEVRERAAASIGSDAPLNYPKEKSGRTTEMPAPKHSSEILKHAAGHLEQISKTSPRTATMGISDEGHSAEVEENVDSSTSLEQSKRENDIRSPSFVDFPRKTMETPEQNLPRNDTPLEYLKEENYIRSSSFVSPKSSTAMETTDEEHSTELEENTDVSNKSSLENSNWESEVRSSSFFDSHRTTMGIIVEEHPEINKRSSHTASKYVTDLYERSSISSVDYSGRETTSLSDNTASFTPESTSEDENSYIVPRSSAARVEFSGAQQSASVVDFFRKFFTANPSNRAKLKKTISKMVQTSVESFKSDRRAENNSVKFTASKLIKRKHKYTSINSSPSSLITSDAMSSSSVEGKPSLRISQNILCANKLVGCITFKKTDDMRNNASALNNETPQNYNSRNKGNLAEQILRRTYMSGLESKNELQNKDKFPERKTVNIAEQILWNTYMINYEPKSQLQSYLYSKQKNDYKQTRLIPAVNTGTYRSTSPKHKEAKKRSSTEKSPIFQIKACDIKLEDCRASCPYENVSKPTSNKIDLSVNTFRPFECVDEICDKCKKNPKYGVDPEW